jgi:hypothetical protein
MNTNGDVILSQNFTAMLEQARNDLQQVQLALQKSTDFNDILDILNRGELCRQYARQQRYGIEIQNSGAEIKIRAATNDRYQTMTVDQIAALPVDQLAADDSRLHLWVPNSFLFEAKDIMDSWGFNYKSVFFGVSRALG